MELSGRSRCHVKMVNVSGASLYTECANEKVKCLWTVEIINQTSTYSSEIEICGNFSIVPRILTNKQNI